MRIEMSQEEKNSIWIMKTIKSMVDMNYSRLMRTFSIYARFDMRRYFFYISVGGCRVCELFGDWQQTSCNLQSFKSSLLVLVDELLFFCCSSASLRSSRNSLNERNQLGERESDESFFSSSKSQTCCRFCTRYKSHWRVEKKNVHTT